MSERRRYVPDPTDTRKVVYNPATGSRRDLEVVAEDGPAAVKTHERWDAARVQYLERLLADPATSDHARACYTRELARLKL